MKTLQVAISCLALVMACGLPMVHAPRNALALAAGCHSGNPLAGVTAPARFQVLSSCASVTGVIMASAHEADGAYQVEVAPDSKYHALLSAGNISGLHGWLLLEIAPFAAALGLRPPPRGTHVHIVGPLVLNRNHGWTEINPVWILEKTAASSTQPPAQSGSSGSGGGSGSTGGSGPAPGTLYVTVIVTPKIMPRAYNHAQATAYTLPGASCTAAIEYDRGSNPLGALFGATPQIADAHGTVTWHWGLDFLLTGGGTVTVTCSKDGQTVTASGRFTIS